LTTRESVLACGEGLRRFVRLGEQAEGELAASVPMAVRRLRRSAVVWTREGLVGRFIARGTQGSDSALVRRSTRPLTAVRRAASVGAPAAGRHRADRRAQAVRPTGEGARGTWQGRLRDSSMRARAWENAEPREAQADPDGEADVARRRLARNCVIAPLFERLKLQKFE
jgi:hypothetical protein